MGGYLQVGLIENDIVPCTVSPAAGRILRRIVNTGKTRPRKKLAGETSRISVRFQIYEHIVQKAIELLATVPYMGLAIPKIACNTGEKYMLFSQLQEYLSLLFRRYRRLPSQVVRPVAFRNFHCIKVAWQFNAYPAGIDVGKQILFLLLECLSPSAVCARSTPVHIHGRNVPFQTVHVGGRKDLTFPYSPYAIKIIFVVKYRG